MTGYQVLGRRKGRGELRRFNLPVVAFGPKATMMSGGDGNYMIYTDLGLYLRGSSAHSAYRRDQLTNIWIPFTPATVTVSNTRFWATDTTGKVWRSGYWNRCDKTGFEEIIFDVPIQRMFIDTFRSHHFTALAANGDIYVMGDNYDGQLGLGDYENRETFVKVSDIPKVKWVMNGYIQSAIITEEGRVFVTGSNDYGTQGIIGLGADVEKIHTFQEIILWKNVGMTIQQFAVHGVMEWGGLFLITEAGDLHTCGYGNLSVQIVPDISGLVQVACAYDFVLVLKQDGSVWGAPMQEDRPVTGTDFYPLGITDIVEICGDGSGYAMLRSSSGQVTFYSSWSGSLIPAEYLPIGEDCCTVTPH